VTSAVIASLNPNRDINESWPALFLSHQRLVSLSAINTFKGFTEGTKVAFNLFDKPERSPLLFFTGMPADRTFNTDLRHFAIPVCNFSRHGFHGHFSF
jgi:hypothetical protein